MPSARLPPSRDDSACRRLSDELDDSDTPSGNTSSSKRVLKIRKEWLDLILSRQKSWEIRSKRCTVGPVLLYEVGARRIVGRADIIDVFRVPRSEFAEHFDKHRVNTKALARLGPSYGDLYAWVLANVRQFDIPIDHDGGRSVTWGAHYNGIIP